MNPYNFFMCAIFSIQKNNPSFGPIPWEFDFEIFG